MKKNIFSKIGVKSISFFYFFFLCFCSQSQCGWNENIPQDNFTCARKLSYAVSNTGTPYIAFINLLNKNKGCVMKFDGTNWINVGNFGNYTDSILSVSLIIDSLGTPFIAFSDKTYGYAARVMKFNGSNWIDIGTPGAASGMMKSNKLQLQCDATGQLYLAFINQVGEVEVKKFDGTSWNTLGMPFNNSANELSLVINSSNTPFLACQDGSQNNKLSVFKFNGINWVYVGNPGITPTSSYCLSLALDTSDVPYLAFAYYSTQAGETEIYVKKFDGSNWIGVGSKVNNVQAGDDDISLKIDPSNNTPHIAYQGYTGIICSTFDGTNWTTTGSNIGSSINFSSAIDNAGTLSIAYLDLLLENKISAKSFDGSNWNYIGSHPVTPPHNWNVFRIKSHTFSTDVDSLGWVYQAYVSRINSKISVRVSRTHFSFYRGNMDFSAGGANYLSLQLDSVANPIIAYQDSAYGTKASVMKLNDSIWVNVGSPGFTADSTAYTSLALDKLGTPYIAFEDYANNKKASVMKFNGISWTNVGTPGFSSGIADFTSIAFDSNDSPYIAFRDGANGQKASVMKFNGSIWVNVGTPGFSPDTIGNIAFAISKSDMLYVAFTDYSNNKKTSVMKFNGTSWMPVGALGFSSGGSDCVSLAVDSQGKLYISFKDDTEKQSATVMKFDGTTWNILGSPGISNYDVAQTQLVIDRQDRLFFSYSNTWVYTLRYGAQNLYYLYEGNSPFDYHICKKSTKTLNAYPIPNATYHWSLPPGLQGSSTTPSIQITAGDISSVNGRISVYAETTCGKTEVTSSPVFIDSAIVSITSNPPKLTASIGENHSYRWMDCDNNYALILGEIDSTFIVAQGGNYAVSLIQNGCRDTSNCISISILDVKENVAAAFSLYPNPTKSGGTLTITGKGVKSYSIISTVGEIVQQGTLEADSPHSIHIKNIVTGLYLICLKMEKRVITRKLVIQ